MRIIYKNDEGSLSIVIPSPTWNGTIEGLAKKDVPAGIAYKSIDDNNIPEDRTFRNAWEIGGGAIVINMKKARDIKRNYLRIERQPLLEKLDIEYMQALEKNDIDKQKSVIEEKQRLRDAPSHPDIEAAKTPDELKAIKLSDLIFLSTA